ncbi:DUF4169 family protein [Abyssibacter sp.]|uniref:DUF4169 family protein n=1 Tax=Abyssibacter sp. TaxID=2320200 RepID=UPI003517E720
MGKVTNLNRVRKRKARETAVRVADENRVRFGRPASQRKQDDAQREDANHRLDQHRRDRTDKPE